MLRRIAFGLALAAVMLASGGCLLRASDSSEPTAIPQLLPSPTPFPTNTFTPEPTREPETIIVTATPDPNELLNITAISQVTGTEPTIDPIIAGVTQTIAAATQISINMTLTAELPDFVVPTATFTLDPTFAVATLTPTSSFVGGQGDCEHIVTAGQNLFRIGLQYGVGYQTIANYNGIANPALITIGQSIIIPNCGAGGNTETGGTGGTDGTGGTGTTGGSSTCGPEIVVDQGETLYGISLRCNVPIRTLMSLNGISNPDLIYFNQTLRLQ